MYHYYIINFVRAHIIQLPVEKSDGMVLVEVCLYTRVALVNHTLVRVMSPCSSPNCPLCSPEKNRLVPNLG